MRRGGWKAQVASLAALNFRLGRAEEEMWPFDALSRWEFPYQITLPLKDNECLRYFGIKKRKKKLVRAWEGSGRTTQKGFPHEFWEVRKMMYALVQFEFLP